MKCLINLPSCKNIFNRIIVPAFIAFSGGFASGILPENPEENVQAPSLEEGNLQPPCVEEISSLFHSLKASENISEETSDYDSDSENEEDYQYSPVSLESLGDKDILLKDKYFLPFFRGLHMTKNSFRDRCARQKFKKELQIGKDIYSSAAHESCPIQADELKVDEESEVSEQRIAHASKIQELIKSMEDICAITINKRYYTNYRDYVQETYTNNYDKFHDFLINEKGTPFHEKQKELGIRITKNPFVSTSDQANHAYKYAYGLKYLGKDATKLIPEYDSEGCPKHPYLGKIIFILIPSKALKELNPSFILNLYAEGSINVSTHFSNDILSEREITFPGYIPGRYALLDLPVRVPSFHKEWEPWHLEKYGLTKRKYADFKENILETKGQISQQKEIVKKLSESIYPKLAKKLQNEIASFLKSNCAHLSWQGLYELSEIPLSLKDVKEERGVRISEYTGPYGREETVFIACLNSQVIKILTENFRGNKPFKVSIDEWDDRSLSCFLNQSFAYYITELTLHHFNVMNEVSKNLRELQTFSERNKNLKVLALIGTEEAYEEDVDYGHNNKYGFSPGHSLYDEDPAIAQFGELIEGIVRKSCIDVLDLSGNDLPNSAIRVLKPIKKSQEIERKVKIEYYDYNQDRDQEKMETMMEGMGFRGSKIWRIVSHPGEGEG